MANAVGPKPIVLQRAFKRFLVKCPTTYEVRLNRRLINCKFSDIIIDGSNRKRLRKLVECSDMLRTTCSPSHASLRMGRRHKYIQTTGSASYLPCWSSMSIKKRTTRVMGRSSLGPCNRQRPNVSLPWLSPSRHLRRLKRKREY